MIFYLLPLVCATALEVKAHVDHLASYQIGINTLARVHEQLQGPAKTELVGFFDGDTSVFRGAETVDFFSPVDFKDVRPAFERIYNAAKCGYVKDAFAFLLKLKKVPHYLSLSVASAEDWEQFTQYMQQSNYREACSVVATFPALFDAKKRQEFLSFLCAYYHAYKGDKVSLFDRFEMDRVTLSNQIKKYLTDQLWAQKMLSSHTLQQIGLPVCFGIVTVLFGSLALSYFDDTSKKLGFGLTALIFPFLGVFVKWWLDQTKYFWEEQLKWASVLNEISLQRTADLLSTFFLMLGYKQETGEAFMGQRSVDQALRDQYGIFLRTRQTLSALNPWGQTSEPNVPLEKLAMRYPRQLLEEVQHA